MTEISFKSDVTVDLINCSASDEMVVKAARVSTIGEKSRLDQGNQEGLINFLIRERHGTPTEHNMFTFYIECPIFVIREFHRHRIGWAYNESSGRYSKLKPEFYIPRADRNLVQSGKPGHYIFSPGTDEQYAILSLYLKNNCTFAWQSYETLLEQNIAKEVARMALPLNIYSSFYATCNARSLMHFLGLRTENEGATFKSHPQWEIQMVANKMEEHFKEQMPITYAAWNNNGRVAP